MTLRTNLLLRRLLYVVLAFHVLTLVVAPLVPRLFGFPSVRVAGTSMAPNLSRGDMVWVDARPHSEFSSKSRYNPGDVIVFATPAPPDGTSGLVAHRVTKMDAEGVWLTTRGDNNDREDVDPVFVDNIMGKVYVVPWVSSMLGQSVASASVSLIAVLGAFAGLQLLERRERDESRQVLHRHQVGGHGV